LLQHFQDVLRLKCRSYTVAGRFKYLIYVNSQFHFKSVSQHFKFFGNNFCIFEMFNL